MMNGTSASWMTVPFSVGSRAAVVEGRAMSLPVSGSAANSALAAPAVNTSIAQPIAAARLIGSPIRIPLIFENSGLLRFRLRVDCSKGNRRGDVAWGMIIHFACQRSGYCPSLAEIRMSGDGLACAAANRRSWRRSSARNARPRCRPANTPWWSPSTAMLEPGGRRHRRGRRTHRTEGRVAASRPPRAFEIEIDQADRPLDADGQRLLRLRRGPGRQNGPGPELDR